MEAANEARLKQTALDYVSAVLAQRKPEQAFIPLLFAAAAVEPSLQKGLEIALAPLAISILVGAELTPLVSGDAVSDTSFPFGKNAPAENLDSDPVTE